MSLPRSSRNRQILVARIRARGVIIAFRYARCMNEKLNCVRSKDFLFYLLYIGKILSYKIEPFLKSDFVKIDKERARLDAKKDRTNKEVRLYSSRVNTVLAKTIRIRKFRRFLASRKAEMIRRGLENIEELEKLEE
jgi:hypothetical protein